MSADLKTQNNEKYYKQNRRDYDRIFKCFRMGKVFLSKSHKHKEKIKSFNYALNFLSQR